MAIQKLAVELDETIRQTRELVKSIDNALNTLMNKDLSDANARYEATNQIMIGLQAQDRIEQRCANITKAIKQMTKKSLVTNNNDDRSIWKNLSLDELSKPEMSCSSSRIPHGEVDLF